MVDLSRYVGETENQPSEKQSTTTTWNDVQSGPPAPEHKLSYIGTFANSVYDAVTGSKPYGGSSLVADLAADQQRIKRESEIATYAGGFVKTATLFLRGKFALPATLLAYALDEAKPGDSVGNQLLDAGLGAAKGGTMRGAFSLTNGIDNIALKGVTLGIASRGAEVGFSRDTYRDASGNFSLDAGVQKLGTNLFSKQAIGTDIIAFGASAGMLKGADTLAGGAITRSPFLSTIFTGTTFGVTNGGLSEIHRQSQTGQFDLGQIAKSAGIQGALDTVAAIPGGMQARSAQIKAIEDIRQEQQRTRIETRRDEAESVLRPSTTKVGEQSALFEPATGEKLLKLSSLLSKPEQTQVTTRVENPERPAQFTSEQHFLDTAIKEETVPGRLYRYGGTEIAMPETFAQKIDAIRDTRVQMGSVPEAQHWGLAQKLLGDDAHLAYRALPEDLIPAIDRLPDPSLIRRITLTNTSNPEDVWHQIQTGDRTFKSAASTSKNGEITFYQRDVDPYLVSDVSHEWSHILRNRNPVMADLFDAAAHIEKDGYMQRSYARTQPAENWAVHAGEDFLHPDPDFFYALAKEAPLRTVAIAKGLESSLKNSQSPEAQSYRERLDHVNREVLPVAQKQLLDIVRKGPGTPGYDGATQLLLHISTPEQLAGIREMRDLDLSYTQSLDATVQQVGALKPHLQKLDLSSTPITKKGLSPLFGAESLRELYLADTAVDDQSVWVLPSMKSLRVLDLSRTDVSDLSMGAIAEIPNLQILRLNGTTVSDRAVARLLEAKPWLRIERN